MKLGTGQTSWGLTESVMSLDMVSTLSEDLRGGFVQDDGGHEGEGVASVDAEAAQFLDGSHAVHPGSVVWPIEVVEGQPSEGEIKILGRAVQFKQGGDVKLFVVCAVQPFDAAVVAFPSQRVAAERCPQGREVFAVELCYPCGVVSSEFLSPVGLYLDRGGDVGLAHPPQTQPQEGHGAVSCEAVGVGHKSEPGACLKESPLVARKAGPCQVSGALCAEGGFVVDVFYVGLHQREGLLGLPGPVGRIEAFAPPGALLETVTVQDISYGPWREGKPLGAAQPVRQSVRTVAGSPALLHHPGLQLCGGFGGTVVRPAASVGKALSLQEAPKPFADGLSGGAEAPRGGADRMGLGVLNHLRPQRLPVIIGTNHVIIIPWTHRSLLCHCEDRSWRLPLWGRCVHFFFQKPFFEPSSSREASVGRLAWCAHARCRRGKGLRRRRSRAA